MELPISGDFFISAVRQKQPYLWGWVVQQVGTNSDVSFGYATSRPAAEREALDAMSRAYRGILA